MHVERRSVVRGWISLVAAVLVVGGAAGAASAARSAPRASGTITLELPKAFNPIPPRGGHDLYHCALLDPKVTTDQMITSTTFTPGTPFEVHHAVMYWVPPSQAGAARKLDGGGRGWTCFGGPGIGGVGTIADLGATSWLSGWGPGHGTDKEPAGTGMPLPAGSLIVMQIHYNLLAGHKPDRSKLVLQTVPAAGSGLLPLKIDLYPTAIDVPCPTGVTGKLCSRAASLADIGKRFGKNAVTFDNILEDVCHRGTPVASDTTSCTWPVASTAYIWRITPHMHLLGVSFRVTLDPGTANQKVLLNVPIYNFHYQRAYDMSSPVQVGPGDRIQVSCTFNPLLRGELQYLKNLPPRYVLWADGSSDEMCLAIMGVTASLTPPNAAALAREGPSAPQWPASLVRAADAVARGRSAARAEERLVIGDTSDAGNTPSGLAFCGVSF